MRNNVIALKFTLLYFLVVFLMCALEVVSITTMQ